MDSQILAEYPIPPELCTFIRSACLQQEAEKPPFRFKYWGTVRGISNDYHLIQASVYRPFSKPLTFYSRDGFTWTKLPDATPALLKRQPVFTGLYTGDPASSVQYTDYIFDGKAMRETNNQVREEERLAYFVHMVDKEGLMIPKGSYELSKDGFIRQSPYFKGLSYEECTSLRYYQTFVQLDRSLFATGRGDFSKLEPLQQLTKVFPEQGSEFGRWRIRRQPWESFVTMRNTRFPGLMFAITPGAPVFHRFYIGDGLIDVNEPFVYGSRYDEQLTMDVGIEPGYDYTIPPDQRMPVEDPTQEDPLSLVTATDKTYTTEVAGSIITDESQWSNTAADSDAETTYQNDDTNRQSGGETTEPESEEESSA